MMKKRILLSVSSISVFLLTPLLVSAQGDDLRSLFEVFQNIVNQVLVPLIFVLAFLVFVWGMFSYYIFGAGDEDRREKGKNLMIYGLIAFFVMISLWGIVNVLANTFGLGGNTLPDDVPQVGF